VEGARLISAALEVRAPLQAVYLTRTFADHPDHRELLRHLDKSLVPISVVDTATLKTITTTVHPAGIVGVCALPENRDPDPTQPGNWLYLDRIRDPGNLGTLLRTAAWFNVPRVALSPGCIDPYNPKVVRGGMGAHFSLELFTDVSLAQLTGGRHAVLGADPQGTPPTALDLLPDSPWILVLGSEAHGLSPETKALLDHTLVIPRPGSGESLNVAVAGGILLYLLALREGN
jgi:TrmH family RNA methyltransferase